MVYLYDACDQISDFCHQQLLRKMRRKISWTDERTDGQTDRGKTVYPLPLWRAGYNKTVYPPPPFGERGYNKNLQCRWCTYICNNNDLRRLDHIVPAHLFRTWLSRVFHHKTMLLSAKCNGKVRVTARKQIIQILCEKSVNYCKSYLPLILARMPLDCLQIKILYMHHL